MLFAIEKLDIDNATLHGIATITLFAMGAMLVYLVGYLLWHFFPAAYSYYRNKRTEKAKAENGIWFDIDESVLHRGKHAMAIERKSFEYFVCKITFLDPNNYHNDQDIYDNFDDKRQRERAVYQAVLRLNKKGIADLGLKDALFKRGKNSTSVNNIYRLRIINKS